MIPQPLLTPNKNTRTGQCPFVDCGKQDGRPGRVFKTKDGKPGPWATCLPHLVNYILAYVWIYVND
jgi:hypothetical protein